MSGWQPRQRRAVETRRRLLDAAVAEMARVGVDEARIEDIVAAAGVSWGSFYRYFPAKEDVLLEAAATVAEVFADACDIGAGAGRPAGEVIVGAFWRAASAAPTAPALWEATFRALGERPERVADLLAGRNVAPPAIALGDLIDAGQRRGELRGDVAAAAAADAVLTAAWAAAVREGPRGVTGTRLPAGSGAGRASRRTLTVGLLVDGLRPLAPQRGGPARSAPAERLGRRGEAAADLPPLP